MAAERAAAEHERDSVKEQLSLALSQTRALELACQEWVVEVQREARVRAEATTPPRLCADSVGTDADSTDPPSPRPPPPEWGVATSGRGLISLVTRADFARVRAARYLPILCCGD